MQGIVFPWCELAVLFLRSPATRDAALAAHTPPPVVIVAGNGFDWIDAGVGAMAAFAASLAVAGTVLISTRTRAKGSPRTSL